MIRLKSNINLSQKTILITGAAGFIGANLSMSLLHSFVTVNIIGIDNMNDYYDVSLKEYRLKQIKELVNDVSEEEFMRVIPELRLAFSYFTPREIDEIGENVSKMYGISKRKFDSLKGISPNVVALGEELDKVISEFMKEEGL